MDRNHPTLVTIGIPTFNRADGYLREALRSALRQTYGHIEIIVSDNCSTDRTGEIVRSFDDPRLKYFRHEKNIGPNRNFNFCLEQANGLYFLLLHDDDLIDEDFIETCMDQSHKLPGAGIIRTGTRLIDGEGRTMKEKLNLSSGSSLERFCYDWFEGKTSLFLCSTLYNTARLKEIGGFNSKTNLFQDVVSQIILAKKYGKLDIKDVKASFRKHSGEMTFSKDVSEWCTDSLYLLDIICDLADDHDGKIRDEGMTYFCKLNYKRASSINSYPHKILAYAKVYREFGYACNPFIYVYNKKKRYFQNRDTEKGIPYPINNNFK